MATIKNLPLTAAPLVTNTAPAEKPGPEPLVGRHVTLERLTEAHLADLWESIGRHAKLWTWWPEGPFETQETFCDNIRGLLTFKEEDLVVYAVIMTSGGGGGDGEGKAGAAPAAGLALALSQDRTTNRIGEFGLFYGPALQRTRAATEVFHLLGGRLFALNHRRVGWKTNALNLPSRRAAERLGFVHEATLRQDQINKGRSRDSVWFSIIDAEWPLCDRALGMWLADENFDDQGVQRRRLEDIRESLR